MPNLRVFLLLLLLTAPAFADDYARSGSGKWSDSVWNGSSAWADGNTAVLTFTDAGTLTLDQNASVAGVTTTGTGTISGTSNTLTFSGGNFSVGAGSTLTYSAKLAGSFTKTDAGTLKVTTQSTSNVTTVNVTGGTLTLAAGGGFQGNGTFGNAALNVSNGATLEAGVDFAFGKGTLTIDSGTLYITGKQNYINQMTLKNDAVVNAKYASDDQNDKNSYRVGYNYYQTQPVLNVEGTTGSTINAGISMVSGNNAKEYTMNVADTTSDADLTINGVIFDYTGYAGLPLKKAGAGALKLTAANTFNGGIQLTAGKLILANTKAAGAGVLSTSANTSVQLTNATTFNLKGLTGAAAITADAASTLVIGTGVTDKNVSENFTGTFGSNLTIQKEGAGTFTISSYQETYAGLIVNGGTVKLNTPANYGQQAQGATPITVNSGAKLELTTAFAIKASAITVNGGTLHNSANEAYINNVTLKNGATVSASGNSGNFDMFPNSIRVGNNYQTGQNPTWTVEGTTGSTVTANLNLTSYNSTLFTLNVGNTNDDADLTISGILYDYAHANGIPVKKTGAGTLRLTNAASTFANGLTVAEGNLQLGGLQPVGFGTLTLNSGTSLKVLSASEGGSSDGITRVKQISGAGSITGPTSASTPATLQIGAIYNTLKNQWVSAPNFTLSNSFSGAGLTLEKIGTNTLELNKSGGSTGLAAVKVTEGTLTLKGSDFNPTASHYGYFGQTPITVADDATLKIALNWQIQGTPVILDGENAKLVLNSGVQTYADNLTLKNGADVEIGPGGSQLRIGYYDKGSTVIKVSGGASEISSQGGSFLIVSAGGPIEQYGIDVADGATLTISAKISDHPNSNNSGQFVKKGDGTLVLTNTANDFKNGIVVEAGNLVIAEGAGGKGKITLSGNTTITPAVTSAEEYTPIGVSSFPEGSSLNLALASESEFSRFTFSGSEPAHGENGFVSVMSDDSLLFAGSSFKVSNLTTYSGDLESWLLPEFRYGWNLTGTSSGIFLSVDGNAVPEPATWLILLLGVPFLFRKRGW